MTVSPSPKTVEAWEAAAMGQQPTATAVVVKATKVVEAVVKVAGMGAAARADKAARAAEVATQAAAKKVAHW